MMVFQDEIKMISNMMTRWGDTELTVAIYYMMNQLKTYQLRFLLQTQSHLITRRPDWSEVEMFEKQVNNADAMTHAMKAMCAADSKTVSNLHRYVLLLHPGNEGAKKAFLSQLPPYLNRAETIETLREVLSYCLVHPGFSHQERKMLEGWVHNPSAQRMNENHFLMQKALNIAAVVQSANKMMQQSNGNGAAGTSNEQNTNNNSFGATNSYNDSWNPESYSVASAMNQQQQRNDHQRNSYNNHIMPSPHGGALLSRGGGAGSQLMNPSSNPQQQPQDNNYHPHQQHQHVLTTNGGSSSNNMQQATNSTGGKPVQNGSVMEPTTGFFADVQVWLKSLRLHKYADLFAEMSYDEMMELTPEKLDEKNVTKGARNKIILSIKRLRDRFSVLQNLEKDMQNGSGSLRTALLELKNMIHTPIKHYDSQEVTTNGGMYNDGTGSSNSKNDVINKDDIPSQYTKVMGKACAKLLTTKPDEENLSIFVRLLDRCIQHPSFTETQKRRLRSWKQQTQKMHRNLARNMRPLNNGGNKKNNLNTRSKFDPLQQSRVGVNSNGVVGQQPPNQLSTTAGGGNPLDPSQLCRPSLASSSFQSFQQHQQQQQHRQQQLGRSSQQFGGVHHGSSSAPRQQTTLMTPANRQIELNYHNSHQLWYSGGSSNGNGNQTTSSALTPLDSARRAASLDPRLGSRVNEFDGLAECVKQFMRSTEEIDGALRMFGPDDEAPNDLNTRLDSLCLSVAEHALNDGMEGTGTIL